MADGDGAQSGADDTQSSVDESTTGNGSTSTTEDAGTQSGAQPVTEAAQAVANAEAYRERMRAADQRAAKFEQELKQLRDKDLPEAEKLQRDYAESQKQVEKLGETNRGLAVKIAFLQDNTNLWHNPETAMKLLDREQIEVGEDGAVSGMKAAITALAKEHPYLLKEASAEKEELKTPPGTATANNGSNGTGGSKPGALASRLPVMRTRLR
jgi:hypothetical protein